jgi:hypothetical protein
MICVDSKVGNPYILSFHPNRSAIRNMLIKNYLHQLGCSWHRVCCTSFGRRREISNFSRTLLRHFRSTIDASGGQSEVDCFLAGDEVLLTLLGPAKSSICRTALLCSSALACSLVCERPEPCYRRAVFIGDDLAVRSNPRSPPPHRQGALLAPHQRRQPHTLESIDEHEYSGYACRGKHFLCRLFLSGQWTALRSRWAADKQLDRAARRLHV